MTEELVQSILLPGLEPGAAEVFLEFLCYSDGPLPEELLPLVKVSFGLVKMCKSNSLWLSIGFDGTNLFFVLSISHFSYSALSR